METITTQAKLKELSEKLTGMQGNEIDNTALYNVIAQLSHISRTTGKGFNFKVGTAKKWAVVSMAKQRNGYVQHCFKEELYRDETGKVETAKVCSNVGLYDLKSFLI